MAVDLECCHTTCETLETAPTHTEVAKLVYDFYCYMKLVAVHGGVVASEESWRSVSKMLTKKGNVVMPREHINLLKTKMKNAFPNLVAICDNISVSKQRPSKQSQDQRLSYRKDIQDTFRYVFSEEI